MIFTFMVDPMLEQVQIDGNGNLYSIYESNAAIYCDGNKNDDFKVIDFNRLAKNKSELHFTLYFYFIYCSCIFYYFIGIIF